MVGNFLSCCINDIGYYYPGGPARENVAQPENSVGSSRTSKSKLLARASQEQKSYKSEPHSNGKLMSAEYYENHLWLGPRGGSSGKSFSSD